MIHESSWFMLVGYLSHTAFGTGTIWAMRLCSNQTGPSGLAVFITTVYWPWAVTLVTTPSPMPPIPMPQVVQGADLAVDAFSTSQVNTTSWAVTGAPFDQCQSGFSLMVHVVSLLLGVMDWASP